MHAYRGDRVCTNKLLIARTVLESRLLEGLQAKVLHRDVVSYALSRFEERLTQAISQRGGETDSLRKRIELPERQLRNCTEAIADMVLSISFGSSLASLKPSTENQLKNLPASNLGR